MKRAVVSFLLGVLATYLIASTSFETVGVVLIPFYTSDVSSYKTNRDLSVCAKIPFDMTVQNVFAYAGDAGEDFNIVEKDDVDDAGTQILTTVTGVNTGETEATVTDDSITAGHWLCLDAETASPDSVFGGLTLYGTYDH